MLDPTALACRWCDACKRSVLQGEALNVRQWVSSMTIEKTWYELSPYLFGVTGASASLYGSGSLLLEASGLLLFAVAVTILGMRWAYRADEAAYRASGRRAPE